MSFFGALGTAVTGINAMATWIGNISDNVANATTNGFKEVSTDFSDLMMNKVLGDSPVIDSNKHGGVTAKADFLNRKQGGIVQDDSATSIAVIGQGFIPVVRAVQIDSETGEPTFDEETNYYTRLGDFKLTNTNHLANSAGYYLMANPVGDAGAPELLEIDDDPIDAEPTTTINYNINLPSNAAIGDVTTNISQYVDANGEQESVTYTWTKTANNVWELEIEIENEGTLADGTFLTESFTSPTYTFTFVDGLVNQVTDGTTTITGTGTAIALDLDPTTQVPAFQLAAEFTALTFNFGSIDTAFDAAATSQVTQLSTNGAVATNFETSHNGLLAGEFVDVNIEPDGLVRYNYTNGRTQALFQVPLVNFAEPDRLDRVDGTAFIETSASGQPLVGIIGDPDGETGIGKLAISALELSNVDVAEQLTHLILAQQAYSLNGQVVTAADEMLTQLVDLKR